MKLLLIDTEVDYDVIISSLQPDVDYILFNQYESTLADICDNILEKMQTYEDIGIVQHADKDPVVFKLWKEADTSSGETDEAGFKKPPTGESFNKLRNWLLILKEKAGLQRLDLFACSLFSNPKIRNIIFRLEKETGVDLRASSNPTGNTSAGGDWIMESDNVDIRNKYFTDGIADLGFVFAFFENTFQYGYNENDNNQDMNGNSVHIYAQDDLNRYFSYGMAANDRDFPPSYLIDLSANDAGTAYTPRVIDNNARSIQIVKKVTDKLAGGLFDGEVFLSKVANNRVDVMDDDYDRSVQTDVGASPNAPYGTQAASVYLNESLSMHHHVVYNRNFPYTNAKRILAITNRVQTAIAVLKTDNRLYLYLKPIYGQSGTSQISKAIRYIHKLENVRDVFHSARAFFVTFLNNNKIRRYTINNAYRFEFLDANSLFGTEISYFNVFNDNLSSYINLSSPFIRSIVPLKRTKFDNNDEECLILFSNGEIFRTSSVPKVSLQNNIVVSDLINGTVYTGMTSTVYRYNATSNTNVNRIYSFADGWIIVKNNGIRMGIGFGNPNIYTKFSYGFNNDLASNTNTFNSFYVNNQSQYAKHTSLAGATTSLNGVTLTYTLNNESNFQGYAKYAVSSYFATCIVHDSSILSNPTYAPAINIEVKGSGSYGGESEHPTNGQLVVDGTTYNTARLDTDSTYSKLPRLPAGEAPIRFVVATHQAFAAYTATGKVFCWGHVNYGGIVHRADFNSTICYTNPKLWSASSTDPITKLYSNHRYFFGLTANGNVLCWGGATDYFKKVRTFYNYTLTNERAIEVYPFQLGAAILLNTGKLIYRYVYPNNEKTSNLTFTDDLFMNLSANTVNNITTDPINGSLDGISQAGFFPYYAVPSMKYRTRFLQFYQFPSFKGYTRVRMSDNTYKEFQYITVDSMIKTSQNVNVRVKNIIMLTYNLANQSKDATPYGNWTITDTRINEYAAVHAAALQKVKNNIYKNFEGNVYYQKDTSLTSFSSERYYQIFLEGNPYTNDLVIRFGATSTTDYIFKSYCNFSNYVNDDKIGSGNKRLNAKYGDYIGA